MRWLVLVSALAAGCGLETGGGTGDPLLGNWISQASTACAVGANFDSGHGYALNVVCVAPDASLELQSEVGSYALAADRVLFTAARATCADTPTMSYLTFSATPTSLTLSSPTTVLVFSRNTATGNGAATYGCFRAGAFAPAPLAPL